MPRLRIDHHGIDGVGVQLPLPPIAAFAAGVIGRRGAFQHQAFGHLVARGVAQIAASPAQSAKRHAGESGKRQVLRQGRDHLRQVRLRRWAKGVLAQILPLIFQQIIGQHPGGQLASSCFAHRLAANALLQIGKGAWLRIAPNDDFTVNHRALRQKVGQAAQIRESGR